MWTPDLHHLITIILLVEFNNIADAQYEGDSCNHALRGTLGICKKLNQCVSAIHNLLLGMYPQNCGFAGTMPIVCCTTDSTAPVTKTSAPTITATKTEYDNSCYHALNERPGICKKLDQCDSAIQDLRLGVYPQNCGFVGTMPIVCCTTDPTASVNITSAKRIAQTITATTIAYGNSCYHALKGTPGICKKLNHCGNAIYNLLLGIYPQNCGFVSAMPIVCCPSDSTAEITTTSTNPAAPRTITTITATTKIAPKTTAAKGITSTETVPITAEEIIALRMVPTKTTTTTEKYGIGQLAVGEKSRQACERFKMLAYKKINSTFDGESELIGNCPWEHRSVAVAVQGKIAQEAEFPHLVLIGYIYDRESENTYNWLCGGSLISEKYVLTSAECILKGDTAKSRAVRLGDLDYADPDNDQYVQEIKIKNLYWPPQDKYSENISDIGLIELERPADLSLHVKPICLYRWNPATKVRSAIVAGWGSTSKTRKNSKLFKGVIQNLSPKLCHAQHLQDFRFKFDSKTKSCFGRKYENHTDVCTGDGGVPLQIYNKDVYCSYYAFAISSSRRRRCGKIGFPSFYTNIYPYLAWIESIVWP